VDQSDKANDFELQTLPGITGKKRKKIHRQIKGWKHAAH
jgi:hypothetical protein